MGPIAPRPTLALLATLVAAGQAAAAPPHAGSLDRSFGDNGRVVFNLPGERMHPRAMAVQPDGKIVVAGYLSDSADAYPGTGYGPALVVRFTRGGTPDATFGEQGVARVRLRVPVAISALAVQPDGGLVLAGRTFIPEVGQQGAIARLLPGGTVDAGFGEDGVTTVSEDPLGPGYGDVRGLSAVAIQPDGRIVAGGEADTFDVHQSAEAMIARLLPDGRLDATFDGDGSARYGESHAGPVLVHPDGDVIVLSWSDLVIGGARLAAVRLGSGPVTLPGKGFPTSAAAAYTYHRPIEILGAGIWRDGSVAVGVDPGVAALGWARFGPALERLGRGRILDVAGVDRVTFDERDALLAIVGGSVHRFRGRRFAHDRSFGDRDGRKFLHIAAPAVPIGSTVDDDKLLVAAYTRSPSYELAGDEPLTLVRLHARQDGAGPVIRLRGLPRDSCLRGTAHPRIRIRDESRVRTRVRLDGHTLLRSRRGRLHLTLAAAGLAPGRHRVTVRAIDAAHNLAGVGRTFRSCPG